MPVAGVPCGLRRFPPGIVDVEDQQACCCGQFKEPRRVPGLALQGLRQPAELADSDPARAKRRDRGCAGSSQQRRHSAQQFGDGAESCILPQGPAYSQPGSSGWRGIKCGEDRVPAHGVSHRTRQFDVFRVQRGEKCPAQQPRDGGGGITASALGRCTHGRGGKPFEHGKCALGGCRHQGGPCLR